MGTREVLEDICNDECDGRYCILKEFMASSGFSERQLEQVKCVEKFKFEESRRENRDIGWQEAWRRWTEEGYSEKFARVYSPKAGHKVIYERILNYRTENKPTLTIYEVKE